MSGFSKRNVFVIGDKASGASYVKENAEDQVLAFYFNLSSRSVFLRLHLLGLCEL